MIPKDKRIKCNLFGLVNHVLGDLPREISLEDILEAEEGDLRVFAASALEVGLQVGQAGRVLQVV